MTFQLSRRGLVAASVCAAAFLTPHAARGDVVAGNVLFPYIDSTWAWGDSMGGGGDDSITWWSVSTNGITEWVANAKSGSPTWDRYAHAQVRATVLRNVIPNTPLRIEVSHLTEGFVLPSSPHTWELASVRFGGSNSADFMVTDGHYRYEGPVPLVQFGKAIQPGDIVGPGYCRAPSFVMPEAYVKIYKGQTVQDGPHFSSFEFTFTPLCPSDINHDGWVNGDDFDEFTQWFDAGDSRADYDGNGWVNGDDFDGFVVDFDAGC